MEQQPDTPLSSQPLTPEMEPEHMVKRRKPMTALEKLIDESTRWIPGTVYAIPTGFTRDRNGAAKRREEEEQCRIEKEKMDEELRAAKRAKAKLAKEARELAKKKALELERQQERQRMARIKAEKNRPSTPRSVTPKSAASKSPAPRATKRPAKGPKSFVEDMTPLAIPQGFFDLGQQYDAPLQHPHQMGQMVRLKWVFFDHFEEYCVDFSEHCPALEICKVIQYTGLVYLPRKHSAFVYRDCECLVSRLWDAFVAKNISLFAAIVEEFNVYVETVPLHEIHAHLETLTWVPKSFVHDFLNIVYNRSVQPEAKKLKKYEAFSDFVYGELLPNFLSKVYDQVGLQKSQVFLDLGSGVGNCTLQASLEYGCSSYGCEIMDGASELAEKQLDEFNRRCKLWGLRHGDVDFFLRQSFVDNEGIKELLPKVDVLLVNNFIFHDELNKEVIKLLQLLKTGCHIISLKSVRPHGYTINYDNIENILNRLKVQKHILEENSVSWTSTGGEYWISHVTDDLDESIFKLPTKGKVRGRA